MRKALLLPALTLFFHACGGGGAAVTLDVRGGDGGPSADRIEADLAMPDVALPDGNDADLIDLLFDGGAEELAEPGCKPGEGCFLDPCSENLDCQSGWCVLHMGQAVCSTTCQEECPAGWGCKQVAGTEPDVVYICVSNAANLCKPCATAADCMSPAGQSDACLELPGEGSFCGAPCANGACPFGFSCTDASTVDGVALQQCLPDLGACPCTDTSVALGLWTPCETTGEFGACAGKRVCLAEGLSPCDAPDPAAETCNGLDDDCDGEVDEPDLVGGNYVNLCDDQNPCTVDSCAGDGGCKNAAKTEGECSDDDPCTVADHCDQGICVGELVDCDDGNSCTDDWCKVGGGCAHEDNSVACDDGDVCTVADQCSGGICAGTEVNCECLEDADCQALEDGNLCNGTLACDTTKLPHLCKVKAGTEVTCPAPAGVDAICLKAVCDPATGACAFAPDHEAMLCDDEDLCTVNDKCVAGTCTPGVQANCNDGNPCTDDACDSEDGCVHTANAATCSDGDACTVGDVCADGQCVPGGPMSCDDLNPCTTDWCDPAEGCAHVSANAACDDGNACTVADHCEAGQCVAGAGLDCNDDNICTNDTCDPKQGCIHQLNSAPCDDKDVCTTGDHCHLGACISSGTLACNDGNPCTDDGCHPLSGCAFTPNSAPCDDGNACTAGDQCVDGACKAPSLVNCTDGNPCTDDSCNPASGCVHSNFVGPCNDGDACTTDDVCANGACAPGAPLDCDDGNGCTDDSCNPAIGCVHVNSTEDCDDGNACTIADACADGQCTGQPLGCDDGNPCTDDSCDPDAGCQYVPNSLPCDDLDACTQNDLCGGGQCAGQVVECDDGNGCTEDSCAPETGCLHLPITPCCGNGQVEAGEGCDDGNLVGGDGCSADCQLEQKNCSAGGQAVSLAPSGTMMICEDPAHNTCEQDMEKLCPAGWHLCSHLEFYNRNTNWNATVTSSHRALGVIQCRGGGGAGHYTVPDAPHSSWNMSQDAQHNCYFGSSRPECTAGYGCNEKEANALCCAPNPKCGNGQVDSPEEACDDGNNSNGDACLNICAWRTPLGGGTNCN